MNTTTTPLDFVIENDLNGDGGISAFFFGNVAFALLACIAVTFTFALRQRNFGDFPIVGKYEDLYQALMEGTEMVGAAKSRS